MRQSVTLRVYDVDWGRHSGDEFAYDDKVRDEGGSSDEDGES